MYYAVHVGKHTHARTHVYARACTCMHAHARTQARWSYGEEAALELEADETEISSATGATIASA